LFFKVVVLTMAVTGLHSGEPKILYHTRNIKDLIEHVERIVVLV